MSQLTQTELMRLVTYDPNTGCFTRASGKRFGRAVGSKTSNGYVHVFLAGKTYKAHRLAWLYEYGYWPNGQIDHINHDRADNRIINLRDVTCAANHQNRRRLTKSASGVLGVTWHKRDKQWQAYIETNFKSRHLGYFKCLGAAIRARMTAEIQDHTDRPM